MNHHIKFSFELSTTQTLHRKHMFAVGDHVHTDMVMNYPNFTLNELNEVEFTQPRERTVRTVKGVDYTHVCTVRIPNDAHAERWFLYNEVQYISETMLDEVEARK